jgi:hypothetical protein
LVVFTGFESAVDLVPVFIVEAVLLRWVRDGFELRKDAIVGAGGLVVLAEDFSSVLKNNVASVLSPPVAAA